VTSNPPTSWLCTQGGELDVVKLLDFGLVKELRVGGDIEVSAADSLTGTPQYMAPESIRAPEAVDARTDMSALELRERVEACRI
jgi:eukaryotic-like serine/threonine-protein kinase